MINTTMSKIKASEFFDDINFESIVSTIKGIYTSDGSMSTLLDFERVLDESDLYAFRNWELGELVAGPNVKRYTVDCTFMYPLKLMPDPSGAKRLLSVGCNIKFKKTKIKVPIEIKNPSDYKPGTHYPKMIEREIWLIRVEMPKDLMNDIREGSIDLAGQNIDLDELDSAYENDLDTEGSETEDNQTLGMGPDMGAMGGMPPAPGQPPAMGGM
jgi:hypothetical protein